MDTDHVPEDSARNRFESAEETRSIFVSDQTENARLDAETMAAYRTGLLATPTLPVAGLVGNAFWRPASWNHHRWAGLTIIT